MGLTDRVQRIRADALKAGKPPVPDSFQGVTKDRVRTVLRLLDRETQDCVDAVFALLDDQHDSWFSAAPAGTKFCEGATIAHIACHIGILQRGSGRLDREGRDYWIKPLRGIGVVEPIYFDSNAGSFRSGHPIPKSPNSAYRLEAGFVRVLMAVHDEWNLVLKDWVDGDTLRDRLVFQAQQAEAARSQVNTSHVDLIRACCEQYAPRFLRGFEVIYVDDGDGDRVTDEDRARLRDAGLELKLTDATTDVMLWNRQTDALWVIEAVKSDGEVDGHKVQLLRGFAERHGKKSIGFTTAYPTWKFAAQRQGTHKNIAPGTFVWIREDASKHYRVESFPSIP